MCTFAIDGRSDQNGLLSAFSILSKEPIIYSFIVIDTLAIVHLHARLHLGLSKVYFGRELTAFRGQFIKDAQVQPDCCELS